MTPPELRNIRQRLDWSQNQAADQLGVSLRNYRNTEHGLNSHGKPVGVSPVVAVAMLAFALAADIEVSAIGPDRLVEFCRAVQREGSNSKEPS